MKIYRVYPGINISGMPKVSDLPKLAELDLIITLSKKHLPLLIADAIDHRYAPIKDGRLDDSNLEAVGYAVALTVERVKEGEDVLIHCLAGRNRSALVAALAFRALDGVTGQAAYEHIMGVRPNALHNPHFAAYLKGLP